MVNLLCIGYISCFRNKEVRRRLLATSCSSYIECLLVLYSLNICKQKFLIIIVITFSLLIRAVRILFGEEN